MRIALLLFCSTLLSLSSCEDVDKEDSSKEEQVQVVGVRAVVSTEYSVDGCPVLLEIEEDGRKVLLMPVELKEKFKVHGAEVLIEYHLSRIMQSECQIGRPIVVDDINFVG